MSDGMEVSEGRDCSRTAGPISRGEGFALSGRKGSGIWVVGGHTIHRVDRE